MRATFLGLALLAALTACNRDPAPQTQPEAKPTAEKADAAQTPPAARPAPPVAADTTRDAASHAANTGIPVVLTVTQGAGELKDGMRVFARFAASQASCRVGLEQTLAAGQGGEGKLTCDTPLDLRDGAFEFSLHAANRQVADGVVLQ